MLQACGQGSCRAVGNPLLLGAGRGDKRCVLTCCDLHVFPCLYFQNGTWPGVIMGLGGLLGWVLAKARTSQRQGRGQRTNISHISLSVPHFC